MEQIVSIPYLSGHPFLHNFFRGGNICCVNPLSIRTPISTVKKNLDRCQNLMCQSPIYQDTHFYDGTMIDFSKYGCSVSIPYLSGHPFLHTMRIALLGGSSGGLCQSPIYQDTHFYSVSSWMDI